jgi:hypothetical protein
MFRRKTNNKQSARQMPSNSPSRKSIVDETDQIAGRAETTNLLVNALSERRYCDAVGTRSSYHTSTAISARPSPSTFEQPKNLIAGKR